MKPKINGHRQTICVSLSYSIKVHLQRLTASPPLTWCSPVQHIALYTQTSQNNNSAIFVVFPTRIFSDVNAWSKRKHWVKLRERIIKAKSWEPGDLVFPPLTRHKTLSKVLNLPLKQLGVTGKLIPPRQQCSQSTDGHIVSLHQAASSLHCCNEYVKNSLKQMGLCCLN